MMHRLLPAAAALALLSVTACDSKVEEVDSRAPDPMAAALKNAAPVELPPAVEATVTFRCQPGNTLVYVDFFQGRKLANFRSERGGTPTQLTAAASGEPFSGGGYTMTGTPTSITYTGPDGTKHDCKA